MEKNICKLCGITVRMGEKNILENFSIEIKRGFVTGIAGKSGKGKTTLLRTIAGLEKHTEGTAEFSYNKLGYVFQEHRLLPWVTLLENTALPLIRYMRKKDAEKKAYGALESVLLDKCADMYPENLSGGMARRAAIARALAYEPDLLLLDEPFSGQDSATKKHLIDVLKAYMQNTESSVVLVSHHDEDFDMLSAEVVSL